MTKRCKYCTSKFVNRTNLNKHLERKHKYRCDDCRYSFTEESHHKEHLSSGHIAMRGAISKKRKVVKRGRIRILAPSFHRRGAVWCYSCGTWSRGCKKNEHNVRFVPFLK